MWVKGKIIAALILGLLLVQMGRSQTMLGSMVEHPYFDVDYAYFFIPDKGTTNLEVYLEIPNNELQFYRAQKAYEAGIEVSAYVYDEDGNLITDQFYEETIQANDYEATIAYSLVNLVQFDFFLEPGNYLISIQVTDKDSKRTTRRELKTEVPAFHPDQMGISSLELARKIVQSPDKQLNEDGFTKNGRRILPLAKKVIPASEKILGIYFELYGLENDAQNGPNTLRIQYVVKNTSNEVKIAKSYRIPKPECATAAISFNCDLAELPTGDYSLTMTAIDEDIGVSVQQTAAFFRWSNQVVVGLPEEQNELEILRFIATKEELTRLKRTPPAQLAEALANFWKSKDPTPGTEENELMQDYYYRVALANQAYSQANLPGWQTDQGKTLIRFGVPDLIRKSGFSQSVYAYEIWEYQKLNLRFVFVDENGFGEYKLWSPTALSILQANRKR